MCPEGKVCCFHRPHVPVFVTAIHRIDADRVEVLVWRSQCNQIVGEVCEMALRVCSAANACASRKQCGGADSSPNTLCHNVLQILDFYVWFNTVRNAIHFGNSTLAV